MADVLHSEARVLRELFVYSLLGAFLPLDEVDPFVSRIGRAMVDVHLHAGEIAYRQGDLTEQLFFVVTGELELNAEGAPSKRYNDRSVLVIDALLARPRARTAVAATDVHLLTLEAETWFSALEDSFEAARGAIQRISQDVQALEIAARFEAAGERSETAASAGPPPDHLALVDRILALRNVDLLQRAHMQAITMLADLAEEVRLVAGEPLLIGYEAEREVLLVVAGEIIVSDEQAREHSVLAGQLVGGTGSLAATLPRHHARASVPSLLLRVRHDDYWDVLEEHVDLVRSALFGLATARERLRPTL